MAINYSIEEADLSAEAAVIESLWVGNLVGHVAFSAGAKLRLGYLDNPAGQGAVILLKAEGLPDAQGALGLHPRRFHLGPRAIRAIGLADYAVDAMHRSLGPALQLMRFGARIGAERFDLTYGFPNAKAAPVFKRAGLQRLGEVKRYAKLLASRERLARHMPHWLARCCAPLVDRTQGLRDRFLGLSARTPLVCLPATWEDPSFDAVWARRPAAMLLSERTGAMLRWRFGAPGRGDWQVCVARDGDGTAHGYVVWRRMEGFAEVGDFFTNDPTTSTLPLMLAFSRLARRSDVQSISVEYFGSAAVARQLRGAGLVLRPERIPVFTGASTSAVPQSAELWYLTRFDSDAD